MTISIVIPTFNGEKYIQQTIQSVLNQTHPADEIIISDDGSYDQTIKIVNSVYTEYRLNFTTNVPLIIKLNPGGPSGFVNAWNRAISMASGDFISVLHQDDILYPDFLETFVKAHQQFPYVRHFFAPCDYIGSDGQIIHNFVASQSGMVLYKNNEYLKAYQKSYGAFPHIHRCAGVITHHSIFEEGCLYAPEAGHIADDDFFYRVCQFTNVVGIMKPLAAFRAHDDSETSSIGNTKLVSRLARDYIYQIYQWQNSTFLDREDKYYFEYWAVKYVIRMLFIAILTNNLLLYNESVSCFVKLHNYEFVNSLFFSRVKMYLVRLLLLCKNLWNRY